MADLLERVHLEKSWAITAKTLLRFLVNRGSKIFAPTLGKGEGIISPVLGAEKWTEIIMKIYSDSARKMFPLVKERFNIKVEGAIGAAKLVIVAATLLMGPEWEYERVEESKERTVIRTTKCAWWEGYKELAVDHTLRTCDKGGCHTWVVGGLNAINPKLTFKLTKALPRGDPYCEYIFRIEE